MIISQILQFFLGILQSVIPLTTITFPVLPLATIVISAGKQETAKHQSQSSAIRSSKRWCGVNGTCDDTRDITERNRPRGADSSLVVTALIVLGPSKDQGLSDVSAGDHEESGKVKHTWKGHWN